MQPDAASTDSWAKHISSDDLMSAVDRSGLLTAFAEATETSYGTGPRLFRDYFEHRDRTDLKHLYLEKCREVYEAYGGKEEKVHTGPPLGRLVPNPDGDAFGDGVKDPDPLVGEHSVETRTEEVLKLQRVKKDLELGVVPKYGEMLEGGSAHEMGETYDRTEYATRKFWKISLFEKDDAISRGRCSVLVTTVIEFLMCIVLFALGAQQLEGGRTTVVIATFASSVVGVISSTLGFFGSLPEAPNEYALYLFYASQVWLTALLTTFIFVEISFIYDNESRCNPSLTSYAGSQDCTNRAELVAALIVGFIKLLIVLYASCATTELLDGANYQSSHTDKFLVFKYKSTLAKELQMPLVSNGDWDSSKRLACPVLAAETAPDDEE